MSAPLLYFAIASLDGYVNDATGDFGWAMPDTELHGAVNDLERNTGTYLYGRRMYEVMRAWDTDAVITDQPAVMADYAQIWRAADKIVYSATLREVTTRRTQLRAAFDSDDAQRMKEAAERPISVAGPGLAAAAFRAGLVDEVNLFVVPIIVGGGTRALPDGVVLRLQLAAERRFGSGVVHLQYLNATPRPS
ncbi:MAG: dihydrofolate reductase family protein [Candidatus Dormibacteria bacterium]